MLINILLALMAILAFGALVFGGWILWGALFYDVPFVTTSYKIAQKMVHCANLKGGEKIYDLGCGVGTILFSVVKIHPEKKFECIGYDLIKPALWWAHVKNFFIPKIHHSTSLQFKCADIFKQDLSSADVIFCYLISSAMERFFLEKWEELKPGCKIISHGFSIPSIVPMKVEPIEKGNIYVYKKRMGSHALWGITKP